MKAYMEKTLPLIEKAMKDFFPENLTEKWARENLSCFKCGLDLASAESALNMPVHEFMARGGKRIRALFTVLAHQALGGTNPSIYSFSLIPEMIHNGSLIVDDIEDNSVLRRGKPALHKLHGVGIAVNAGNFMYFLPQLIIKGSSISDAEKSRMYSVIAEELSKLHVGQALDIQWSKTRKYDVSKKQYLQMVAYKTGALMSAALKIGALLADASDQILKTLGSAAMSIGSAFQIQDDILNLKADWGKEFGEDITEGKLTYLVACTIKKARQQDRSELIRILSSKTKDGGEIKRAIGIMEKYKAFDEAQKYAEKLLDSAKKDAVKAFPNSEYRRLFFELIDFMLSRKV